MLGAIKIDKKRTFISLSILIWFLFPFLQSFYTFKQHGVRYIIEIYAPFAILCALGLEYLEKWFKNIRQAGYIMLAFVSFYMVLTLQKVAPYYLDYFNEVVGGNNYVYQHRLFQMGWWGQGIFEAANYISEHEVSKVTVAVNGAQPAGVMPDLKNIKLVYYDKDKLTDYVIVPYFDVVRIGFDESALYGKYKVVYIVRVAKAELVRVYKKVKSLKI
jgi:hypothetical protein